MDVGNKERMAEIAVELGIAEKYTYSDSFLPIRIVAYEETIDEK